MLRATLATMAILVPTLLVAPAAATSYDDVVVAVLDSGIYAGHSAFAPGQIVAWRDFVGGQTSPYDDDGHGTAVASMVGGIASGQTPSASPGVKLAIGKVLDPNNGVYWTDLIDAIRWSVDTVRADVISISLYNYYIEGGPNGYGWSQEALMDTIGYARSKGVLVVLLAGNGYGNGGVPSMSYFHTPIATGDALIVGGATNDGLTPKAPLGDMEPEVVSAYTVRAACTSGPTCTAAVGGTSFATPLVAGAAARLLGVAREIGQDPSAAQLETLLKRAARDTAAPPTLEGYGYLAAAEANAAEGKMRARQDVAGPTTAANEAYVENVQRRERELWRNWQI